MLALIAKLNADPAVNGILVQLPLPAQIDSSKVIAAIDPAKDVDGFHPVNVGRLSSGLPSLVPCTPFGCVLLAKTVHASLAGLDAVVIGRSNIVGKPVAQLLLAENATVTIAHSKTRDLPGVCRRADIWSRRSAAPEIVRKDWIKPGATVIDVGINRVPGEGGKSRIVGDVAPDAGRGCRRADAGARRRRADDDCVPAPQHVARRLRATRATGAKAMKRMTLAAALLLGLCGHAAAQSAVSAVTPLDLKKCRAQGRQGRRGLRRMALRGLWRHGGSRRPLAIPRSNISFGPVATARTGDEGDVGVVQRRRQSDRVARLSGRGRQDQAVRGDHPLQHAR